ncbi:MAG: DUF2207 domain-containing protein [Eubacteriaceae bacterium]|nr:DUF2207 domain-containing protein [Eubacteriaceae bacterium]
MRRTGKALLLIPVLLLALTAFAVSAFAESGGYTTYDSGYYIKDYQVDVEVNSDRSYDITETLTVHFSEPRHGIKRNIPTWAELEREVRLLNVSVEGADYSYDGYGEIKIGSADYTVTGDVTYVIRYTLWHYADEEPDADYVYLNLIGTEWNTYTEHYSATMKLPEGSRVLNINLTGGYYGSTDSIAQYSYDEASNVISVFSERGLNAYEGVTINVAMEEGAFRDAEVWVPELEMLSHDISISLDDHAVLRVRQDVRARVNKECGYYFNIVEYAEEDYVSGVKYTVYGPDGSVRTGTENSAFISLYDYRGMDVSFAIEYEKHYNVRNGQDSLSVTQKLFNGSEDIIPCRTVITAKMPFNVHVKGVYTNDYTSSTRQDFELEMTDGGFVITVDPYRNNTQDIVLETVITDADFVKDMPKAGTFAPLFALAAVAAAFMYGTINPRKPFTPVPEFYPPDGLTPPEMGYIINNDVRDRDMVSMIYYWASKKLLRLTFRGGDDFTLNRTGLDSSYSFKSFERPLFEGLWKKKHPDEATKSDLRYSYYRKIDTASKNLVNSYGGENALMNRNSLLMADVITKWIPDALVALSIFLCYRRMYDDDRYTAVLAGIVMILFINGIHRSMKNGWTVGRRGVIGTVSWIWTAVRIVLCGFLFAAGLGGYLAGNFLCGLAGLVICLLPLMYSHIARRSEYGYTLREKVEGFRMFLDTAEKSRLEMLLESNPDYYYDILPYAQVLGVTKQWTKKFDGILIREPQWLDNRSGHVFTYSDYNSMNHSFTDSMTSRPSSSGGGGSSGGGFSSGGGGSFSSGGFSGGGSGGGGGSSW